MLTSVKQLLKIQTTTTDLQIQTKDQVKFNAVERTRIDSLSIHEAYEVVAEMSLTTQTTMNAVTTPSWLPSENAIKN